MRSISAVMSVSLDGVVQGLGRADEDTRGGFRHGGWGQGFQDEVMAREMGTRMSRPGDMLFGRRTWQDFVQAWSHSTDGNPFTTHMNAVTKYVVSRTLSGVEAWENSRLLTGEAVDTVRDLKSRPGNDLSIIGSASLVRALQAAALIDVFTLLIHPLVLGAGARLFDEVAARADFALVSSVPTTTGVIIAQYNRR
jgi:dihydrofolate reductase